MRKTLAEYQCHFPAKGLVGTLLVLGLGCSSSPAPEADPPSRRARPSPAVSQAEAKPALPTVPQPRAGTVQKVSLTPVERVFAEQNQLERKLDVLLQQLAETLQDKEIVEVQALRRVYSTGAFLRELGRWLAEPGRAELLTASQRRELAALRKRWENLRQLTATLTSEGEKNDEELCR